MVSFPRNPSEVLNALISDLKFYLPALKKAAKQNSVVAITTAIGLRVYDLYTILAGFVDQLFPDTAKDIRIIERWGALQNVFQIQASQAVGFITLSGTVGTTIPIGTTLSTQTAVQYETLNPVTISSTSYLISSFVKVGSEAFITTTDTSGLASGTTVAITGFSDPLWNGPALTITVLSSTQFKYTLPAAATASPTLLPNSFAVSIQASVEVISIESGSENNQISGTTLTLDTPIVGVGNTGFVGFSGIIGGSELEDFEVFRQRILQRWQSVFTTTNEDALVAKAKEVDGLIRVFVLGQTPQPGAVTMYLMFDNRANPIPTAADILAVKNKVLEIKDVYVSPLNIIVLAPTPVPVNIVVQGLSPNTASMKAAITGELQDLFKNNTSLSQNVPVSLIQAAVLQATDPETQLSPTGATIVTAPATTVVVPTNSIATYGGVSFI